MSKRLPKMKGDRAAKNISKKDLTESGSEMKSSDRFNIALVPVSFDLQARFSALAQKYFSSVADGYILGPLALAHVTLCQFYAVNADHARKAFDSWNEEKDLTLKLENFQLRQGLDNHAGRLWAQFSVCANTELIALQKKCVHHLQGLGLKTRTPVDGFSPHLTLARTSERPAKLPTEAFEPFNAKISVGVSSELGVLKALIE